MNTKKVSRRAFLAALSAAALAQAAVACQPTPSPTLMPTLSPMPTATASLTPTATATAAPTSALISTAVIAPTATPTLAPTLTVAVAPTATPTLTPAVTPTPTPEPTSSPEEQGDVLKEMYPGICDELELRATVYGIEVSLWVGLTRQMAEVISQSTGLGRENIKLAVGHPQAAEILAECVLKMAGMMAWVADDPEERKSFLGDVALDAAQKWYEGGAESDKDYNAAVAEMNKAFQKWLDAGAPKSIIPAVDLSAEKPDMNLAPRDFEWGVTDQDGKRAMEIGVLVADKGDGLPTQLANEVNINVLMNENRLIIAIPFLGVETLKSDYESGILVQGTNVSFSALLYDSNSGVYFTTWKDDTLRRVNAEPEPDMPIKRLIMDECRRRMVEGVTGWNDARWLVGVVKKVSENLASSYTGR